MAPFFSFLALFVLALSATVLASPHIPRHHAHRAPADAPLRRSVNARSCIPQPSNATSAYPTTSSTPAPINVAPTPTAHSSVSVPPSSTPSKTPTSTPSPTSTPVPTSTPTPTPTPAPTSTPTATSSTPSYAAPVTSSASGSGGAAGYFAGTQHGYGTWFADGLGACGYTNTTDQYIVAVAENLYDGYPDYNGVNPNSNPICGRNILVTYGSTTISVEVVDRCVGCKTPSSLDLSQGAFSALADLGLGVIGLTWEWAD